MPSYGANIQVNLHTADPGEPGTAMTNVAAYTGYVPVLVPRDNTGWTICDATEPYNANPAGSAFKNAAEVTWPECTGAPENLTHFSLSAPGSNQILYSGALSDVIAVANVITPRAPAGTLRCVED